jgi:hypothetical protein
LGNKGLQHIAVDDPEATLVSTRHLVYLPYRYVALFLSPAGYTLLEAWEQLYPALVATNDLPICGPLINWLRVISMGTTVPRNANVIGPTTAIITLQVPIVDQDLIHHRQTLQKQVLPGLFQPAENLEMAITQMAAAVTQNTNDNRQAREEKLARSTEPKLPSEKFTVTLNILLEYLETADEANLPSLWHNWANCKK